LLICARSARRNSYLSGYGTLVLSIAHWAGNKKIVDFSFIPRDGKNRQNIWNHQKHLLNAQIEWEVSNYRVVQNPLSLGRKIKTIYHTALSAYSGTPSLSLKSSTC